MKNRVTVVVTIIITMAVLFTVGGMSAFKNDDQKLSFTDTVTVSGGKIVSEETAPVHFDPVGETCSFAISVAGPDGLLSDIRIYKGDPLTAITSDPIYSTTGSNLNTNTGDLSVNDQNIYIRIKSLLKENAGIEDGEWAVAYSFILHTESKSAASMILPFAVAALLTVLAIVLVRELNKTSEKEYDEMQLLQRGKAAINAFIITVVTAMGFAFCAMYTTNFPLTVYETVTIITVTGAVSFGIICDINDAFVGFREKRIKYAVLFWVLSILAIFGSGLIHVGERPRPKYFTTNIIIAVYFAVFALELTINYIVDKRNGGKEDADEES